MSENPNYYGNYKKKYEEYFEIKLNELFDVHHIDGNRENNNIENLLALPKDLHNKYHKLKSVVDSLEIQTELPMGIFGYGHNEYVLKMISEFALVYSECLKWSSYKQFLLGSIPNIYELNYERKF